MYMCLYIIYKYYIYKYYKFINLILIFLIFNKKYRFYSLLVPNSYITAWRLRL